jgi:hypothetical protein
MGIPHSAFKAGDVYIDFPQEEVQFRFVKATGKVFRRFYGDREEEEIPHSSGLFNEAIIAGTQISPAEYGNGAR